MTQKQVSIHRNLPCELTSAERDVRFQELRAKRSELDEEVDTFKDAKDDHKATVKKLNDRIEELETVIDSREEYRVVDCTALLDFDTRRYIVTRNDTGETVEDRDLRDDENQMELIEED